MSDTHDTNAHDDHHGFHVVPVKYLLANGIALLILTVVTVLAAKVDFVEYDMAEMNIIVALAIALVKATLVCLFFMHLFWDRQFHGFVLVGSVAFVVLFIGFAMTDTFEYGPDVRAYEQNILGGKEVPLIETALTELGQEMAAEGVSPDTSSDDH